MRESSRKIQPWRASVQYACKVQYKGPVITGPVAIAVVFILPRPKGHWSKSVKKWGQLVPSAPSHHVSAPDVDKLLRGILDPMTVRCGGCVLADDSQVIRLSGHKRYQIGVSEEVGAKVVVEPLV